MARFIKATDVERTLRFMYGKKPSDALLRALSDQAALTIRKWSNGTHLKKVQTWQPDEDGLRAQFGGKRAVLKCWTCGKRKEEVVIPGKLCDECAKARGGE